MHAAITAVTIKLTKLFQMKLKTTKRYWNLLQKKPNEHFGQPKNNPLSTTPLPLPTGKAPGSLEPWQPRLSFVSFKMDQSFSAFQCNTLMRDPNILNF